MPFCTRIDSRSPANNIIVIKTTEGEQVAVIEARSKTVELSIDTSSGYRVEKPKGEALDVAT